MRRHARIGLTSLLALVFLAPAGCYKKVVRADGPAEVNEEIGRQEPYLGGDPFKDVGTHQMEPDIRPPPD